MFEGQRDGVTDYGGGISRCGRFMRRHNLSLRSRTIMCQKLPADYQDKSFGDYVPVCTRDSEYVADHIINMEDSVKLFNKFAKFFSEKVCELRAGLDETNRGTVCNQDAADVSCNQSCEFHSISSHMLLKFIKQSPTKFCILDHILTSLLNILTC